MMRVSLPLGRFPPPGHDHTRPVLRTPCPHRDRRGQMHEPGDRTDHPLRMVDEPDELPQIGLPAQIDHASERRVVMASAPDLDKLDAPAEVIDHLLPAGRIPPFDRIVIFPTRDDDPVGRVLAGQFHDLRSPLPLALVQMDVAVKSRGLDPQAQAFVQEFDEGEEEMFRKMIAPRDEWVMAVDYFHPRIAFLQRREVGILQP